MLYLGGGYPELHGEVLARNVTMRTAIRQFAERGGIELDGDRDLRVAGERGHVGESVADDFDGDAVSSLLAKVQEYLAANLHIDSADIKPIVN
jgi:hypothetical protein